MTATQASHIHVHALERMVDGERRAALGQLQGGKRVHPDVSVEPQASPHPSRSSFKGSGGSSQPISERLGAVGWLSPPHCLQWNSLPGNWLALGEAPRALPLSGACGRTCCLTR